MTIEKEILNNLEYLSDMNSFKDQESTWKPIMEQTAKLIKENIVTNLSLIYATIRSIPDNIIREYLLEHS